ncbi:MAG: TrmH family RNA methyltransferase [Anaerococcus sp.]
MIITSDTNPKYKYIKKLSKKKYRNKYKAFVIESKKIVEEASNPDITKNIDIEFVFVNEDMKDFQTSHEKIIFSNDLFEKISSMKNPEGISAVVKEPVSKDISSDKILLLDHIQDPGNLGTMVRSAEAFGFSDIILFNDCVDIHNEKCLRASMGSVFRLNFLKIEKEDLLSLKKEYGLISADMGGLDYRDLKNKDKILLCIGNEANGISNFIRENTDEFVAIPMKGKIESLNAAIAASILMNNLSL